MSDSLIDGGSPPQRTGPQADYVALAEVARPHGIRGELRLKIYNPDSDLLASQRRVRLVTADGEQRTIRLKQVRPVPGALLVRIEGVNDRDAAEALRGARIEVPRSALEDIADEDEFYVVDLIGSDVQLDGESIGRVSDVAAYPTCDALVVTRPGKKRLEIPLQGAYVGEIADGVVSVLSLDGLE